MCKNTHFISTFLAIGGTLKCHFPRNLLCTILFYIPLGYIQGSIGEVIFLSASTKQNRKYISQLFCFLFSTVVVLNHIFTTARNWRAVCCYCLWGCTTLDKWQADKHATCSSNLNDNINIKITVLK